MSAKRTIKETNINLVKGRLTKVNFFSFLSLNSDTVQSLPAVWIMDDLPGEMY